MRLARQYLSTLTAGIRLAFFVPTSAGRIHGSAVMLLLLFASAVFMHLVRDFAFVGLEGQFFAHGLPGVLLFVPFLLAAAVVVAWASGRAREALLLATAFAALSLPILAVELLLSASAGGMRWPRWISWQLWQWLFPAWTALACALAAAYLLRPAAPRMLAGALALAVLVALPLGSVFRDRTLWAPPFDENAAERRRHMAAASEDAFYQQPKVLERTLQGIAKGRPGVTELYYVGMGGYAHQDVFLREVKAVEKLMRERFGAEGRAASLLNNPQTIMETPIASATSLRAVLRRVGEAMDRDEDILFLFMTSHGSRDHKFSLEFWPLQFNDLTPQVLRAALDDAGIQWRVIVVSACYAGGFINALKDERTIVIAAAGPDKKSFGCSHEAQWTYFGEAFFDRAMRDQLRVTDAYAAAREAVAAREKKEGIETPSDPQLAAGPAMERKWDEYLGQLARAPATAPAAAASGAPRDVVERLVALAELPAIAEIYHRECLREMASNAPDSWAERDPSYLGGQSKDSAFWQGSVAAWERFAEDYCRETNDAGVLQAAYRQAWREVADKAAAEAVLRYLSSPQGKRYLEMHTRVTLRATGAFTDRRRAPADRALARYQEEVVQLNASLRNVSARK